MEEMQKNAAAKVTNQSYDYKSKTETDHVSWQRLRNKWDRITKREASREVFIKYVNEFADIFALHGKIDAAQALKEYEEK